MRRHVLVGALCAIAVAFALSVYETPLSAWNPSTCDFTTGGGFIVPTASGAKGTFGVGGGCKNGSGTGNPLIPYWGHLEYHDHGDGTNVHGIKITGYLPDMVLHPDPYARLICGTGRMGTRDVDFVVRTKDGGQPSANKDEFDIIVTALGGGTVLYTTWFGTPHTIVGGDIQLHKPNKSNTGMFGGDCPALPQQTNQQSFTLTVSLMSFSGASGRVTSVPFGIDCMVDAFSSQSGDCRATFDAGTEVGLTAIPNIGSTGTFDFTGGLNCDVGDQTPACTVTMNGNRTVSATFNPSE
jgi:hypothetical protein